MEIKCILFVLAFAFEAFAAPPAHPMITMPARLAERQFDSGLIGYYSDPGLGYSALSCNITNTYTTSGIYARCCSTAAFCSYNTGCLGTRTVLQDFGSGTCYPGYVCTTRTILLNISDRSPVYQIGCWTTLATGYPELYTVVRTPPVSSRTTRTSSTRSITTTRPPTTPFLPPSSTSTDPGTATPAIGPTSTPTPTPTGKKNKAWIAAAVVGPILALAILALAFWIYKLRKGKPQPEEQYPYPPAYPSQPPQPQTQAYYAPQQPVHAHTYYAPPKLYEQTYPPPQHPVPAPQHPVSPPLPHLQPEPEYYNPKTPTPEMPSQP